MTPSRGWPLDERAPILARCGKPAPRWVDVLVMSVLALGAGAAAAALTLWLLGRP